MNMEDMLGDSIFQVKIMDDSRKTKQNIPFGVRRRDKTKPGIRKK